MSMQTSGADNCRQPRMRFVSADKCTLYTTFRVNNNIVQRADIIVEGRKSLWQAAAPELINFADRYYQRSPVSFKLQFSTDATWNTESHCFQV